MKSEPGVMDVVPNAARAGIVQNVSPAVRDQLFGADFGSLDLTHGADADRTRQLLAGATRSEALRGAGRGVAPPDSHGRHL
jgi:hypothetical protein